MTDHDRPHDHGWRPPGVNDQPSTLVATALSRVEQALGELGELSLLGLAEADIARLVTATTRLKGRVEAQAARFGLEARRRGLDDAVGARHTAAWWARSTQITRGEAIRLLHLGHRCEETPLYADVHAAWTHGTVHTDQARVIIDAIDALPEDLEAGVPAKACALLLQHAAHHDAKALRRLGKHILDVLAPEIAEAHEQRLLEAEEAAAVAQAHFVLVDDGHGTCHGRFTLPSLHGRMLATHLHALANPRRHPNPGGKHDSDEPTYLGPVITPHHLGLAMMDYLERYPVGQLGQTGGMGVTLSVLLDYQTLITGLGVATLSDGTRISASQARLLACQAGLIPAVLGTNSVPLDLGRTARFHNPHQRRALEIRDRGCTAEGCALPAAVCHAHHDQPWSQGGLTNLADSRLLCPRHHRLAHHPGYDMRILADNKVAFHRRT